MRSSNNEKQQPVDIEELHKIIMACNEIIKSHTNAQVISSLESLKAMLAAPATEGFINDKSIKAAKDAYEKCVLFLQDEPQLIKAITPSFIKHESYLACISSIITEHFPKGKDKDQYLDILGNRDKDAYTKLEELKEIAKTAAANPKKSLLFKAKNDTAATINKAISNIDLKTGFNDSAINMLSKRLDAEHSSPKKSFSSPN